MDAWRMVVRRTGGPEVLEREAFDPGRPSAGEVLIEQRAIGLNFIDTYQRSGLYPVDLPLVPGSEAAGVVIEAGAASGFSAGDRVAYLMGPSGAYASHRLLPAERLLRLPDAVSFEQAAAILLKGCTVEMLVERCVPVGPGDAVLVHAAAGGVGSLLVPWLKSLGAVVIAHAGSEAKAARAHAAGADVALACAMDELAERVRAETDGRGVRVVYDGIGKVSWAASLAALARRGTLVTYGNASGAADPFTALDLMKAGSVFVTRPTLADYVADPAERAASATRVFDQLARGVIPATIGRTFSLADAADAHRALEARETVGSTILIP